MSCKHPKGRHDQDYLRAPPPPPPPKTPDASNYTIEEVEWVTTTILVLKVKYPNCFACAFEGNKVMVFVGVSVQQAMRWKKIDPHFRDPKLKGLPSDAPSPAARFPGTPEGWTDAVAYAKTKAQR